MTEKEAIYCELLVLRCRRGHHPARSDGCAFYIRHTIVPNRILFLVTIGLCVLLRILYRIQFQTREKFLEIEYCIAELAEKIERKS